MRVLHVLNTFGLGGAERNVLDLVEGQTPAHDVAVAYLKRTPGADRYHEHLSAAGARVFALDDSRRLPLKAVRRLSLICRDWQPDVVHSHLPRADLASAIATWARMLSPAPIRVSTIHNDEELFSRPGYRQLFSATYRSFDRIIAISGPITSTLERLLRVDPKRVVFIPYGIKPETMPNRGVLRAELGLQDRAALIGTFARLAPQKNLDVLLRAVAMLPEHVHCVVLGADQGEGPRLRELTRELGLQDRVTFLGYRPDARQLLADFDVYCLPSRWEGLPVSLLETALAGVPFVGSAISSIEQVVTDGKTGILVPVDRPDLLADAIRSVLHDLQAAISRADALRDHVLAHYGLAQMQQRTNAVYEAAMRHAPEAG
ncbi:MAG: glycosyltransferase [Acidimicrobiia bacterium]